MSTLDNQNQSAVSGDFNVNATGEKSDAETPSSLQPFVDFNQIALKEKVGHGSYGIVYKALWSDRVVAVKEFGAGAEQKAIETEVKQLSRVRHPNIISLFGISADQQSKYLIMEYAEGGSLHNFLHGKVKPFYSTAHAMSWARQCAEGVAYLHAMKPKPLIHRDLKPLNLLLTNKGRHLKICDFGTVADKSTMMTNNKGSAAWMAPEVFEGSKYTEKCDIFSWAIVLWEVLSRQQPFKEIDNTYSILWKIHKGERPPLIRDCPEPIQNLMTSCWATIPDKRPSMQHVVSVMNELASSFPGAEEPLEYEFINQQIVTSNSGEDSVDNYTLDFSSFNSSNYTSTQVTPTNPTIHSNTSSDSSTPTNAPKGTDIFNPHSNVPTASIAASTRWDVIPEESDTSVYYPYPSQADALAEAVRLPNATAGAAVHYETIRNGIGKTLNTPLAPLSIDVDPAAWELSNSNGLNPFAKNDGKERLTVTDAKSLTENTSITNVSDNSPDLDEDDYDGTDQSLTEMLEPELQPEKPVPNCPESQQIYREHRRLAKEYWRVDTSLYYARDFKKKLLQQMNPEERQEKLDILKKMGEQEELLELYRNLKQQAEKLQTEQTNYYATSAPVVERQASHSGGNGEVVADDGWVVIPSNQNS